MSEFKPRSNCGDETELTNGSEWYWFDICKRIKREQTEDRRVRLWYGQYFVPERTCRCTTEAAAWCFVCSECGKSFPRNKLHLAHNHGEINYCPNCGAKVVSE